MVRYTTPVRVEGILLYIFYKTNISLLFCDGILFLCVDDPAIAVKGRNMIELKSRMQRYLDIFLRFAFKKTLTLPLSPRVIVNGTTVPWSPLVRYLGLTMEYKLIFWGHVEFICRKS